MALRDLWGDGSTDVEVVAEYLSDITGKICIPRTKTTKFTAKWWKRNKSRIMPNHTGEDPPLNEIFVATCCNATLLLIDDKLFFSCGHWWELTTPDHLPLVKMISHCTWKRSCKECGYSKQTPGRINP
jgi:hypothetical protein